MRISDWSSDVCSSDLNLSSSKANSFAPPVVVKARAAQRSGTPNYAEQRLDLIQSNHEVTVGKALAGTGKTTTAIGFANGRLNYSMMYVAFNKENVKEGSQQCGTMSKLESKTQLSTSLHKLMATQKARE